MKHVKARHLAVAAVAAGLLVPAAAVASGEGAPVLGGQRNPSLDISKTFRGETQIIASNTTWGTRQSNKGTGGGAIYGCRTTASVTTSCLRASNLNQGTAFDFVTTGILGGRITTRAGSAARPFTTNATGVATGLNADRVDSQSADQLVSQATTSAAANNRTAQVSDTGVLSKARGAIGASRSSVGAFDVTFAADVSPCLPTATLVGTTGGQISVSPTSATVIRVTTRDPAGALEDHPFSLLVTC